MCVRDGLFLDWRGTLFLVNPKMVTPRISIKLISFESSHQLPPADTTFSLLTQHLDTINTKIKFENEFTSEIEFFFGKKLDNSIKQNERHDLWKFQRCFFIFSPNTATFIFHASVWLLRITSKKPKKKQTCRRARKIKIIYTDRELNCGSNKRLFVIFGRVLKNLCSNRLTKSGVVREFDNAHEPFEKLKNRKARTRYVLTLEWIGKKSGLSMLKSTKNRAFFEPCI